MSDLQTTTKTELEQYEAKLHEQNNQVFPSKYNQIKVSYDQESPSLGKFVKIKAGETLWSEVGDSFSCVILAKRHQYVYFPENKDPNQVMRTEQFEEWNQPVRVTFDGLKDTITGIAKWIKSKYPKGTPKEATYQTVLYVQMDDGEVYLFRVKGAHCTNWFAFCDAMDPRDLLFTFRTDIGHGKEKKGMVTFYPATFKVGDKLKDKEYSKALSKSLEVSKMIAALESESNPNATEAEKAGELSPEDLPFK